MTEQECGRICGERMERWIGHLARELATPVLLIGVGHGPNSGKLVLCAPEESGDGLLTNQRLALLCLEAARGLVSAATRP